MLHIVPQNITWWKHVNQFVKRANRICPILPQTKNSTHRQYEALRAYFVEGLPSAEAAAKFGYSPGSFRVLCSQFRKAPDRVFFVEPSRGPQAAPKQDAVRDQVVALRKQNLSIYDISQALEANGQKLDPVSISKILREEGFAKLPMRAED